MTFSELKNDGSHGFLQVRNADQSVKVKINSSGDSYFTGGDFGIGTTAPSGAKLDVRTNSASLIDAGATINIEEDTAWTQGLALYINNADVYNADYAAACIGVANNGSNIIITAGAKVVNNPASSNGYKTLNSTAPSVYRQMNGAHVFYGDTGKTANTLYTPTERVRILADGNVGIGTTAPAHKLEVAGGYIKIAGLDQGIGWGDVNTGVFGRGTANSGSYLQLRVNGGTGAIHIDSDKNVGIGTTAPGLSDEWLPTAETLSVIGGSLAGSVEIGHSEITNNVIFGALKFVNPDNSDASQATNRFVAGMYSRCVTSDNNAGDDSGGSLHFTVKPESSTMIDAIAILSDGKVGIGTTAPGSKLQVTGDISFGTRLDSVTRYIGKGQSAGGSFGGNSNWIGFASSAADDWITFGVHKSGVGGGEVMRLAPDGNLGIGCVGPTEKLDVNGNIAMSGNATTRTIWNKGYGGAVQLLRSDANATRWAKIGIVDSNGSFVHGVTIINDGNVGIGDYCAGGTASGESFWGCRCRYINTSEQLGILCGISRGSNFKTHLGYGLEFKQLTQARVTRERIWLLRQATLLIR